MLHAHAARLTGLTLALALAAAPAAASPGRPAPVNPTPLVPQPTVTVATPAPLQGLGIDTLRGFLYASDQAAPATIFKYRLATTTSPLTLVGSLVLDPADSSGLRMLIDEERGFGIIVGPGTPTRLVKFSLTTGDTAPPTRLGHLDLNPGEDAFFDGGYDPVEGRVFLVGISTSPGEIVQVDAGSQALPMTRVGKTTLDPGDGSALALAVDPGGRRAWATCSVRVVELSLGTGAALPVRVAFAPSGFPALFNLEFEPLNQSLAGTQSISPFLLTWDVSVSPPFPQLPMLDITGRAFSRPALDSPSGIAYVAHLGPREGAAKFHFSGQSAGLGEMAGGSVPGTGQVPFTTAVDAAGGFIYGAGVDGVGGIITVHRQPPAPGPDAHGYVNKIGFKASASKSSVKAQLVLLNQGTADASNFLVRFFLSSDRQISHDDVEIGKARRVKKLTTNKARRLGFGAKVAGDITGKYLIAFIDSEKVSGDGHYGNNVIVSPKLQ